MPNPIPTVLFVLLLATCAATSNPSVGEARPNTPPPKAQTPAEQPAPQSESAKSAAAQTAQPANAPAASAPLTLGRVAGQPIEAREFLARLWLRDSRTAREVLEQIVFARLALNEADRLGIELAPERVDEVVAKSLTTLEKRLADGGAKLTVDEHIRSNLELEPAFYKARLREDAIVQLLAERSVRAWLRENERCDLRITEVRDESVLSQVRAQLDQGRAFDDVAREFGAGEDEATHTTSMTIVRAENQELARVAFATGVGSVFGPLKQPGRWLFVLVVARHEPVVGPWSQIGPQIESELAAKPVDDLDYVQWRAAMVRRYQVDLEPFLNLVEGKHP